jgi:hypothetical protein
MVLAGIIGIAEEESLSAAALPAASFVDGCVKLRPRDRCERATHPCIAHAVEELLRP